MSLVDDALAQAKEQDLESAAATLAAVAHLDRESVLPVLRDVLGRLAVIEHGIVFRYIPAGTFLMGSEHGDTDEAPVHEVALPRFWLSEVPLSWGDFARVLGFPAPPESPSKEQVQQLVAGLDIADKQFATFGFSNDTKIRLQYCENHTLRARDWHAHIPKAEWRAGGQVKTTEELFGAVPRANTEQHGYDLKPMVAVDWALATLVGRLVSTPTIQYHLPTEAQWERAARGCFVAEPYPWGSAPPDTGRADFDRFGEFSLRPSKSSPPNDFGLYSMAGGVWEWCADDYDAEFYAHSPKESPLCRRDGEGKKEHVLRGGSWADCAEVLRVSFRSSDARGSSPNIGFRLARVT